MEKNISGQICKKDLMGKASFPSLSLLSRSFFIKSNENIFITFYIFSLVYMLSIFVKSKINNNVCSSSCEFKQVKPSNFFLSFHLVIIKGALCSTYTVEGFQGNHISPILQSLPVNSHSHLFIR